MNGRNIFQIIVDENVDAHFRAIDRKDHSLILDVIEQQLTYDAVQPTRNRKLLRVPNTLGATWELRCGANNRYRIFYDVDIEAKKVIILAVGRKVRNKLYIGQEEFVL
ncbi:MAG: hypothetical protein R2911_25820 [Caldilineaceae bacterium]